MKQEIWGMIAIGEWNPPYIQTLETEAEFLGANAGELGDVRV